MKVTEVRYDPEMKRLHDLTRGITFEAGDRVYVYYQGMGMGPKEPWFGTVQEIRVRPGALTVRVKFDPMKFDRREPSYDFAPGELEKMSLLEILAETFA